MPLFDVAPGSSAADILQVQPLVDSMVSTLVMGVGIGVPRAASAHRPVHDGEQAVAQPRRRGGGIFIFFMTGVAFVVGSLSNAYFAKHEAAHHIIEESALLDPGAGSAGRPDIIPSDAARVKATPAFVAYKCRGEKADAAPSYMLKTPAMKIERGTEADPTCSAPA